LQEILYLVSNVSNYKSALRFLVAEKGRQKQQQAESQPEDCKHHVMVECDERKHQLLQAAIAQVTKQYGKESVMWLGRNQHVHVNVISTGSLTLDIALGVGGLPKVQSHHRS
jgi:enoyl-[acyl-carrier-protein] reductase (NADH)